jgi:hypothetical protein
MNRHEEIDIDALALDREYGELSEAERNMVAEALGSEEAYTRYRHTLLLTGREMTLADAPEPASHIRRDLHGVMRQQNRRTAEVFSPLSRLLMLRIPAWQAGLAMAFVAVVMMLSSGQPQPSTPQVIERIVHVPAPSAPTPASTAAIDRDELAQQIADSIIEKVRAEMRTEGPRQAQQHVHRKRARDTSSEPVPAVASSEPVRQSDNRYVGLANLPQLASQKRGKTLAEDSAFTRFTVSMRRDTF